MAQICAHAVLLAARPAQNFATAHKRHEMTMIGNEQLSEWHCLADEDAVSHVSCNVEIKLHVGAARISVALVDVALWVPATVQDGCYPDCIRPACCSCDVALHARAASSHSVLCRPAAADPG